MHLKPVFGNLGCSQQGWSQLQGLHPNQHGLRDPASLAPLQPDTKEYSVKPGTSVVVQKRLC